MLQEGTHKRILSPQSEAHETVLQQEGATYQFWVTASTKVGEGESTRVVTVAPSDKGEWQALRALNVLNEWLTAVHMVQGIRCHT